MPNGHSHSTHNTQQPPHQHHPPPTNHRAQAPTAKERITVQAVPSVSVQNGQLVVGDARSSSTRSYTPLKLVGDGSFGTVWLCDWHGTLPPNTPLSAMQCGRGARPEYAGKRLVAVKRMKKQWEGGWDECKKLKELESLRAIPYHPNIIPLYDFFLLPDTKELYFVFESMEGNLYQLIKTRKGKPLAGGLVSSIFQQVVSGLHHIHESGYFHRDMKPENLLVTTTGLYDYRSVSPCATPESPPESDVVVIVKLADFGLARETKSKPPYTEYVSTRWYRAPEVLLKSRDYSNPVDMWALGTIMAELVNLRPLFPGQGEVDQVARICELLGDPCRDYGFDARGKSIGGGKWPRGVKMARAVGFSFPEIPPKDIYSLFDRSVPIKLVECIADLLKYDPEARLTSKECLEHSYLQQTMSLNSPHGPSGSLSTAFYNGHELPARAPQRNGINGASSARSLPSVTPRNIPPSHSHHTVPGKPEFEAQPPAATVQIPDASSSHRTSFYDSPSSRTQASERMYPQDPVHIRLPNGASPARSRTPSEQSHGWTSQASDSLGHWDPMDISPHVEIPPDGFPQSTDVQQSPMIQEYPARPPIEDSIHEVANGSIQEVAQQQSHGKLGKFSFGKKTSKWGLATMFGHSDKASSQALPPVQEIPVSSAGSTPSLKRTQSSSTDSRSLSELSPIQEAAPRVIMDPKQRKKEAARMQRDAEKQRRLLAEKMQREQARAVLEKSKRFRDPSSSSEFEWRSSFAMMAPRAQKQPAAAGPIRQTQSHGVSSVDAAGGSFSGPGETHPRGDWRVRDERLPKARRRDFDDDHSMSSTDMPSGVSVISFATVDSDPGPARLRHRPSALGISRMTSMSSLGTTLSDEFSPRLRSSTSLAVEQQFANDFHLRASVDSSSISDGGSPAAPPMHMLSLSSPIPWARSENGSQSTMENGSGVVTTDGGERPTLTIPPQPKHPTNFQPQGPLSPYEQPRVSAHGSYPSSPGMAPKSAINPIFKVPPITTSHTRPGSLPPFAQLEAVAEGEYPPLSPMSFTSPEDIANDFS
ncbi:kinase-like protein [Lentinus tigrinus ALCF2SS1-7]|uniref:kinase-like protein n=1 Tax=Lentinus tigrinus ALCF2SS1-7 TaxID=1328758 RepID=UPI001165F558|nr:kinase-like protein [Lentinus tigrinus ALCF2SS1-7]